MRHWLMKTEPDTFSIADLERVRVEPWSGVRSFFARAHMRNMTVGDEVLFYHSSCQPPGVAGLAKVARTNVIDETQFDPKSPYFDEKATRDKPIWDCVDVEFVQVFPHFVTLDRLRHDPDLAEMAVLKVGRLSVQPVTPAEYARVIEMSATPSPVFAKPKPVPKPAAKKAIKKTGAKKPTTKPSPKRARSVSQKRASGRDRPR
jgi:predicted RNA-binding protein with PUA-like domain